MRMTSKEGMSSTEDQLAVLRRMRREGRITREEFDELARSHRRPAEPPRPEVDEPSRPVAHESSPVGEEPEDHIPMETPADDEAQTGSGTSLTVRRDLSGMYVAGLAIAAGALLIAAWLGAIPWFVSVSAVALLATTLFEGMRMVTRVGAIGVAAIVVIGVLSDLGSEQTPPAPVAMNTLPPEDPFPPVAGSLDIYMDQVTDLWNSVDSAPRIVRGLTRHNEIGEYDTFLYRFGEWGRVAGAFDPENEVLYALLAAGQFSGEATEQLYLHLCFMVAPYSQECIESYHQVGLGGGSLSDFTDLTHQAEWKLGEHTWRLEIDQNVVTIRVYGADAI